MWILIIRYGVPEIAGFYKNDMLNMGFHETTYMTD